MAIVKRIIPALMSLLLVAGCSSSNSDPAALSKPTQSGVSAQTGPEESKPDTGPVIQVDETEVKQKLQACVNKLTSKELYSTPREIVNGCFFAYGYNLQDLFGLRDVSELSVSKLSEEDHSTHLYKVSLSVRDQTVLDLKTYYTPDTKQFKVVDSSPTEYGVSIMNKSLRQDSLSIFRGV